MPGVLHIDQQERDALLALFRAGSVRTRQKHQSAWCAVEVQIFLAVDDVIVTLAFGRGLERGEVGARTRLGEALAPPVVDIGRHAAESGAFAPRCRIGINTGPIIVMLKDETSGAGASWFSSRKIMRCTGLQPGPPYSLGQLKAAQPRELRMRCQRTVSSLRGA